MTDLVKIYTKYFWKRARNYILFEFLLYAIFATFMWLHIAYLNHEPWNDSGANTVLVVIIFIFWVGATTFVWAEIFIYRCCVYIKDTWNIIDIGVSCFTMAYVVMYTFDLNDEDKSYILGMAVFFVGMRLISFRLNGHARERQLRRNGGTVI